MFKLIKVNDNGQRRIVEKHFDERVLRRVANRMREDFPEGSSTYFEVKSAK